MDVYLVWHVRHAEFVDGRPTEHLDQDGDLVVKEDEGDDVKVLGLYENQEDAQARIALARTEPGFKDEPDCFYVSSYTLGEHLWVDGFVSTEHPSPRK